MYNFTGVNDAGIAQFEDLNGDGRISTGYADTGRGDRKYYGPNYPQYYGGISNTISYKAFTLDFLFQFKSKNSLCCTSIFRTCFWYSLFSF